VLFNTVDMYPAITGQDAAGAYAPTYNATPDQTLPCSVQYTGVSEQVDELGRITQVASYQIIFGVDPGLAERDKVVWFDGSRTRTMFVTGSPPSEAGRLSAWVLRCVEKL
jgi:hypothetical protein